MKRADLIERALLSEREAAEWLGFRSPQTLYLWRKRGDGPPFVRYRGRFIRYRLRELAAWNERQIAAQESGR